MKICMICGDEIRGNGYTYYGGDMEKPIHLEVTLCLFNLRAEIQKLREDNEVAHKRLKQLANQAAHGI